MSDLQGAEEQKGFFSKIMSFFGKSDLEQKVRSHGIKLSLSRSAKRNVQEISKESPLLVREELNVLTMEKLLQLRTAMRHQIYLLENEMQELEEERRAEKKENKDLKKEFKDLEENLKKLLRPWVNRYPHSDEFTRAYLIN